MKVHLLHYKHKISSLKWINLYYLKKKTKNKNRSKRNWYLRYKSKKKTKT